MPDLGDANSFTFVLGFLTGTAASTAFHIKGSLENNCADSGENAARNALITSAGVDATFTGYQHYHIGQDWLTSFSDDPGFVLGTTTAVYLADNYYSSGLEDTYREVDLSELYEEIR